VAVARRDRPFSEDSLTAGGRTAARPSTSGISIQTWWRTDPGARDIAVAVVYALGYLVIRLVWWGAHGPRDAALTVYYAPIYCVGTALAWQASRCATLDPRTRRAWRLLALAGLCTALSDVSWVYYEVGLGTEDIPFWVRGFLLVAYPLWVAGLLSFPAAPRAASDRAKFWLDLATVFVGGTMASWYMVLRSTALIQNSALGDRVASIAFPVADLIVLLTIAAVLTRSQAPEARRPLRLLVLALIYSFVADLIYGHEQLLNAYHAGDPIDWIWLVDGTLFALAARLQVRPLRRAERPTQAASTQRLNLLPYASVAAGFGMLVWVVRPEWTSDVGQAVFGALTLTILVVVRQVLAARDNLRLLAERAAQEARFRHEALHDPLTGLANRALLRDRAEHALVRASRHQQLPLALIFLDLDNFKTVNDSLGHAAGDALLVESAHRLLACVRATDTVARLGGDEFAIFIEDPTDAEGCSLITTRIMNALERPFTLEGRDLFISASLGLATARDGESADDLLRNADVAMYIAKTRGKGRLEQFAPEMRTVALARMELESDLRHALDANQFVLHYQPIVILETGEITGVEALVRWQHPTRGLLPPAQFIGAAEEMGLIVPLGAWVLREACRQGAIWHERRIGRGPVEGPLAITVNVSGRQLQTPQIVADVKAAIDASGIDPQSLILELTESVLTDGSDAILATLKALKALGVRLAIDDFGTGYSSLSSLHRFPIDILKIAKSFVDDIGETSGRQALAQAIITLGSTLAVRTIAEGIEQSDQSTQLQQLGCQLGQGFHFSVPLPAADLESRLIGPRRRSAAVTMVPTPSGGVAPL
jgi:diguanylate cyclase (GGDEF)-like protein